MMGISIEAFLYSRRNIAGCLLAIIGLVLYFTGIVTSWIWLPIVAALYLIGVLLVPGEHGLNLALDAKGSTADIKNGLDRLLSSIKGKVPDDIYTRVTGIRDSILVTLGANGAGNGQSAMGAIADPNVYLIRQTALSYLPEALNNYMALPSLYANRSLGGRPSPHDMLLSQLDLMNKKMQEVAEAFVAHDTDRLEAHGRFLAEKFASSSLSLDAPSAVGDQGVAPKSDPSSLAIPSGSAEAKPGAPRAR
jgi:hypothetical protein